MLTYDCEADGTLHTCRPSCGPLLLLLHMCRPSFSPLLLLPCTTIHYPYYYCLECTVQTQFWPIIITASRCDTLSLLLLPCVYCVALVVAYQYYCLMLRSILPSQYHLTHCLHCFTVELSNLRTDRSTQMAEKRKLTVFYS